MGYIYYHGPKRTGKAKELRRVQTPAESILWEKLRGKRLSGYKFRRQHVLFDYILDFYCSEKQLVIEIDGPYHETPDQLAKDKLRDQELRDKHRQIIRFSNQQVTNNIDFVLDTILSKLQSLPSVKRQYNYKTTPSRKKK